MFLPIRKMAVMVLASVVTGLFSGLSAEEPALAYKYDDQRLQWGPCPAFLGEACKIAVLHGDPAKPHTDVLFKVPGDYKIPHHWHTSAERMVLVSGTMTVQYDNQKAELIETGMYAFGPEKHPHVAYCEKGDPCVLFIAFNEPIDAFEIMKPAE
ncbi:cupin domain-containing protein [Sulfurimonas sp. ST-25]|uniref:cupin domain-containing protein n=1 Tax=Sulfurimonas sp. ST-25 TaxID=3400151 RepID=UPI003A8990B2